MTNIVVDFLFLTPAPSSTRRRRDEPPCPDRGEGRQNDAPRPDTIRSAGAGVIRQKRRSRDRSHADPRGRLAVGQAEHGEHGEDQPFDGLRPIWPTTQQTHAAGLPASLLRAWRSHAQKRERLVTRQGQDRFRGLGRSALRRGDIAVSPTGGPPPRFPILRSGFQRNWLSMTGFSGCAVCRWP